MKFDALTGQGLNLWAVLDIETLPGDVYSLLSKACDEVSGYRQLLLMGHGGRRLWEVVSPMVERGAVADPIDTFTNTALIRFFAEVLPGVAYCIVYPGSSLVPLQQLGKLVGWHHDSPVKVGVNAQWGSWFAYRALVLVDASLPVTPKIESVPPCSVCRDKVCLNACPGRAVTARAFDVNRCIAYRKLDEGQCRARCMARLACPVGAEHRYSDAQLTYHYGCSLRVIEGMDS